MFSYIWPIALAVLSNTIYQICAKSMPEGINPLAPLIVTYLMGAATTTVLYIVLNRNGSLLGDLKKLNWAPFVLGIVIVGLEVGMIYAYRAGWQVSAASIVCSSILACALIFVGFVLYGEAITWNKVLGLVICLVGLGILNYK